MAVKELTLSEVTGLANARQGNSGVRILQLDSADYHREINSNLYLLDLVAGGWLRVLADDANATTVRVLPGRAAVAGAGLAYAGGSVDLAAYNGSTAYVWAYNNAGALAIGTGLSTAGWPATSHVKLASVPVTAGALGAITDRRTESLFVASRDLVRYSLAVSVQGDTGSASTITITLLDASGQQIKTTDYLRVRVCDLDAYAAATIATIAAGTNTTAVETIDAGKDLVFKSHSDGTYKITLTNATAETVTLRIGAAPLTSRRADYTQTLAVTHAA